MSNRSEKERERLKEEYKDHYRKIRDIKEKVRRSQSVKNISDAVENMNTDELMASVDHFLDKIRDKVAHFEARLDVAMENLTGDDGSVSKEEMDETVRKEQARETIKQVKIEMGLLYNEIEKRADDIKVQKTVGTNQQEPSSDSQGKPSENSRNEEL